VISMTQPKTAWAWSGEARRSERHSSMKTGLARDSVSGAAIACRHGRLLAIWRSGVRRPDDAGILAGLGSRVSTAVASRPSHEPGAPWPPRWQSRMDAAGRPSSRT